MKLQEISKPKTALHLNETLAKTFGQKIDLEAFTLEQLQDARNRVRTSLRDIETTESFDSTRNENYQKKKMYLDVLNAAISERADIQERGQTVDFGVGKALRKGQEWLTKKGKAAGKRIARGASKFGNTVAKNVDDTVDAWNTSNQQPEKKYKVRTKATGTQGGAALGRAANAVKRGFGDSIMYTQNSKLREGAQEQAELVMASKELADTVGKWLQDTAEMQSESMLKLTDAIRDELGQEQADQFQQAVKPTLEALYQALEASRTALTQGVSLLTGEGAPADQMGAEAPPAEGEMGAEPEMEPVEGGDAGMEAEMGDEFAAAEAAGGGTAPEGREQRESRQPLSHQLGKILSSKKK